MLKCTKSIALASLAISLTMTGCDDKKDNVENTSVELKNHSTTPALVKKMTGFENLEVFSLIGSEDKLTQSPDFVFGGSADGAGLMKAADGSGNFTFLVNHEDNFAVSRLTLDKTLKPVKGEYMLNSNGGQWRLCSATLATPEIHGFGPLYLTCGESGEESQTHGINPTDPASSAATSRALPGLGRWSAENAVPLSKDAYTGKTVILIGDDDSNANGGQLALYVGTGLGDLQNGSLYMLKRTDNNQKEIDMTTGQQYAVEFVKIDNHKTLTGAQINAKVDELKAIKFGRVEDIDYRKGNAANSREVYFNVTGQNNTGANADYSRSKYGRVYKLVMNATDPTKGTLELVLNGDDRAGKAKAFQNPDNILVTQNYAYIQEDPNRYKDETHDAYVYQYNLGTGELKVVFELDHHRTAADAAKYNVSKAQNSKSGVDDPSLKGEWEYGAMLDVSDIIGVPNTFTLNIQAHSWVSDTFTNPDKGSLRPNESQGSQIIVIKGLAK